MRLCVRPAREGKILLAIPLSSTFRMLPNRIVSNQAGLVRQACCTRCTRMRGLRLLSELCTERRADYETDSDTASFALYCRSWGRRQGWNTGNRFAARDPFFHIIASNAPNQNSGMK